MAKSAEKSRSASPFPGMDPYMEAHWGDVSLSATVYASHKIQCQLPDDLVARIDVVAATDFDPQAIGLGNARFVEPPRNRFIKIIELPSGRVVTLVELVTPVTKSGQEAVKRLRRHEDVIRRGGNSVQIDLFRAASSSPSGSTDANAGYTAVVARGGSSESPKIYRMPLRERLPTIGIPLRSGEGEVALDLQSLIRDAYVHGRYDVSNYDGDPSPPLFGEDAKWAVALLKEKRTNQKGMR